MFSKRNSLVWTAIMLGSLLAGNSANAEAKRGFPCADEATLEFLRLKEQLDARRPDDPAYRKRTERLAKETLRPEALLLESDRDPVDVVLRRTQALLDDLTRNQGAKNLEGAARRLAELQNQAKKIEPETEERLRLFGEARRLRRRIAMANPLLEFDRILFLTHKRALFDHMCDQYYGFHAEPVGGVYVLEDAFGPSPTVRNALESAQVQNGRLKGKTLENGSFVSLELDYDAQTMLFAWTEAERTVDKWTERSTYHIFKANVDGTNLVQLTDGITNDFDPCCLPNGRIAFISERRGGFLRCGGPRLNPTYTMFGMREDGSDIICLSYHETHEWHPSVANNGMLVYTRWDYVDRDSDIAHHIWTCYPDGSDPRSYHGNYPKVREMRPWMEMSIRAIPDSHRYVAVATPHHGQNYGTLLLIDQRLSDDSAMNQLRRITPDVLMPESEVAPGEPCLPLGRNNRQGEIFGTPWPLSEDYYLCVYGPEREHYALYLIDSFGNRELLYRDEAVPCLDPIPLRPRPRPPVIPSRTLQAAEDRAKAPAPAPIDAPGTVAIVNVYDSDFEWPVDSKVASIRVIQLFPKTTVAAADPRIGVGDQALARGVLGTARVESDGSAHFEVPVGMPVYFQALDARGVAIQTMRSDTFLHPGERLTCQGCHEPKKRLHATATGGRSMPIALGRAPERLRPDVEGSYPLTFPRLVQGVLDRNCVECHSKKEKAPNLSAEVLGQGSGEWGWTRSFHALAPLAWAKHGGNGAIYLNGTSKSIAGDIGARASRLYKMLEAGHHGVKLSPEDYHRITLWLDCNSNFYGAYCKIAEQARGEVVMPRLQ